MKDADNAYGISYMSKQRLKWEYREDLKTGNEQLFCFEILKNYRYTLHCKNPQKALLVLFLGN